MIYYKCLSYVESANACISKELFVIYHYLIEQNNHHICVWVFQLLLINNAFFSLTYKLVNHGKYTANSVTTGKAINSHVHLNYPLCVLPKTGVNVRI